MDTILSPRMNNNRSAWMTPPHPVAQSEVIDRDSVHSRKRVENKEMHASVHQFTLDQRLVPEPNTQHHISSELALNACGCQFIS